MDTGPELRRLPSPTLLALCACTALLAATAAHGSQAGGDDAPRAFYLDTGCEDCTPSHGDDTGKHWVITSGVCPERAGTL